MSQMYPYLPIRRMRIILLFLLSQIYADILSRKNYIVISPIPNICRYFSHSIIDLCSTCMRSYIYRLLLALLSICSILNCSDSSPKLAFIVSQYPI